MFDMPTPHSCLPSMTFVSQSPPHERHLTIERLSLNLKVAGRLRMDWSVEEPLLAVVTHVEKAITAATST
jgi:hypothetical protein